MVDIDHLGVADVGAVLLESDAQDQDPGILDQHAFLVHALDGLIRHVSAHAVVQPPGSVHDTGQHAIDLCLLDEVIRVHADAVAADETGAEFDEVPLAGSGFDHVVGIDAHRIEDLGQFVHEGDVHVTLAVLDDLGSLRHLDARGLVRPIQQHGIVHPIHQVGNLGRGTGSHLLDLLHRMGLVARIDALGAVPGKEIHVEFQSGNTFHHGQALFLGDTRINGTLIHDDIPLGDDLAHRFACALERFQIRPVVLIHRRRHRDHVEIAVLYLFDVRGADKAILGNGFLEQFITDFQGRIVPLHQRINPFLVHVKPDRRVFRRKETGQRQADIAQTDNTDSNVFHLNVLNKSCKGTKNLRYLIHPAAYLYHLCIRGRRCRHHPPSPPPRSRFRHPFPA